MGSLVRLVLRKTLVPLSETVKVHSIVCGCTEGEIDFHHEQNLIPYLGLCYFQSWKLYIFIVYILASLGYLVIVVIRL